MATSSSDASKYFDSYRPSSATASIRSNSSRPKSKSSSRPGSRSESVTNGRSSPRFFLDNSNDHIYFDFHNSDIWPSTGIRSRKLKGRRGKAQLPIRSSSTKKRPKSAPNAFQPQTTLPRPLDFYKTGEVLVRDAFPHLHLAEDDDQGEAQRASTAPANGVGRHNLNCNEKNGNGGRAKQRVSSHRASTPSFNAHKTRDTLRKVKSGHQLSLNFSVNLSKNTKSANNVGVRAPAQLKTVFYSTETRKGKPLGMSPLPKAFVPERRVSDLRKLLARKNKFNTEVRQNIKRHTKQLKKMKKKNKLYQAGAMKKVYENYRKEAAQGNKLIKRNRVLLSRPFKNDQDTWSSDSEDGEYESKQLTKEDRAKRDEHYMQLSKRIGVTKKSLFRSIPDDSPLNELLEQQEMLMQTLRDRQANNRRDYVPTALPARPIPASRKLKLRTPTKTRSKKSSWAMLTFEKPKRFAIEQRDVIVNKSAGSSRPNSSTGIRKKKIPSVLAR
jgi:hypothetical protein